MRIDVHTHVVPARWDDWATRFGGGAWPRLVARDGCRATIMTGDRFFRDIEDRAWDAARRLEDMDRLGIDVQALSPPPVMFCYFPLIVDNPLETALAISKLIFGGVLEWLPDLRICFAHGGGAFPFTLARLNHGWRVRPEGPAAIPREPREYARRLYVDSLTLSAANLRFVVEELGPERVVVGSDYPFDMGEADPGGFLAGAGLDAAVRRGIEHGNAVRFLGLA